MLKKRQVRVVILIKPGAALRYTARFERTPMTTKFPFIHVFCHATNEELLIKAKQIQSVRQTDDSCIVTMMSGDIYELKNSFNFVYDQLIEALDSANESQ